jgi:hypothetical protein
MVPRVEEPPGVELTDQETAVLVAFETEAEKVSEAPARMLAVVGETETEMEFPEEGGGFELVAEGELLQALRGSRVAKTKKNKRMRYEREDMIKDSFGRGRGEGQLDGGPEMGQGSEGKWKLENGNSGTMRLFLNI